MFSGLFRKLFTYLTALSILACSPGKCTGGRNDIPPEDQLHSYITTAVNITKPEQRAELIGLATGELKAALINSSEETFKRAYIDKKYDFKKFEILQRNDQPGGKETQIDFKLVYRSWNAGEAGDRAPVTETTNRATLLYENGQWAVEKVQSLNSSFEWDVGLPLDDVSTSGVTPEDEPVEIESSRELESETQELEDTDSASQTPEN